MEALVLDLEVNDNEYEGGAKALLEHIRPSWDSKYVNFKVFTNGITNKLIGCWIEGHSHDMVLIRIYGQNTDLLIDRERETQNFKLLHKAGYAPQLYAIFRNGLAYEYIPGDILDVESCRCPAIYPMVAKMLAQMHSIDCRSQGEPVLWSRLRKYLNLVPQTYSSPRKQQLFLDSFPDGVELFAGELGHLQKELSTLDSKIVFCHNDLLLANVIHDDGKVTFIDYEYAASNYQAYDIGNHFAEFAGVSNVDYSLYPNRDFQYSWLKIYLQEFKKNINEASDVTHEEITKLYIQVNKFALISHLFWAAWALVQAEHSTIEFDFIGYAVTRMEEYFNKKRAVLSLQ